MASTNGSSTNGATSDRTPSNGAACNGRKMPDPDTTCEKCTHGNKVTIGFPDGTVIFHSQWLHDACCDDGAARNALTALCQQPTQTVHVESVQINGQGARATLDIT